MTAAPFRPLRPPTRDFRPSPSSRKSWSRCRSWSMSTGPTRPSWRTWPMALPTANTPMPRAFPPTTGQPSNSTPPICAPTAKTSACQRNPSGKLCSSGRSGSGFLPEAVPSRSPELLLRRAALDRLRHDAHVGDSRLLHRVHHLGEHAKADRLIGAQINDLLRRIRVLILRAQNVRQIVQVHRLVVDED